MLFDFLPWSVVPLLQIVPKNNSRHYSHLMPKFKFHCSLEFALRSSQRGTLAEERGLHSTDQRLVIEPISCPVTADWSSWHGFLVGSLRWLLTVLTVSTPEKGWHTKNEVFASTLGWRSWHSQWRIATHLGFHFRSYEYIAACCHGNKQSQR